MTTTYTLQKPIPNTSPSPPLCQDNTAFTCLVEKPLQWRLMMLTGKLMKQKGFFFSFHQKNECFLAFYMPNIGKIRKDCVFLSFIQAYSRIDSDLVAHFPHAPSSLVFPNLQPTAYCTGWKVGVCLCCRIKVGACVLISFPTMLEMVLNILAKQTFWWNVKIL